MEEIQKEGDGTEKEEREEKEAMEEEENKG